MIEYLRSRRIGVLRRGGTSVERAIGAVGDETTRAKRGPFWPADAWVHNLSGAGLTAAAGVSLAVNWVATATALRAYVAMVASTMFLLSGYVLVATPTLRGKAMRQFLTDPRDRAAFEAAAADADRIRLTWPALERLGE